mmetsp:Transcript_43521/g.100171  ORF Transcript_43521/g.100171 Transcript_43521/m.100171 type:complete len:731 (-) Transcript_43521:143-2335(-)
MEVSEEEEVMSEPAQPEEEQAASAPSAAEEPEANETEETTDALSPGTGEEGTETTGSGGSNPSVSKITDTGGSAAKMVASPRGPGALHPTVVGIPLHGPDEDDENLPVDFRMQLQLLRIVQEQRLWMQQQFESVGEDQQRMGMQLSRIERLVAKHETHVQQTTEKHANSVKAEMNNQMKNLKAMHSHTKVLLDQVIMKSTLRPMFSNETMGDSPLPLSPRIGSPTARRDIDGQDKVIDIAPDPMSPRQPSHVASTDLHAKAGWSSTFQGFLTTIFMKTANASNTEGYLKIFDLFCGLIITVNAITIGVSADRNVKYALENIGSKTPREEDAIMIYLGYFFIVFYVFELCVKLMLSGWVQFFKGADMKWNLFDVLLVFLGIYENLAELFGGLSSGADLTWLRMLRLLKMMKMFRVVRLMRFFKVLRTMISSIAGSLVMLFWAMLMLGLMMYMFGLCFIYGCSEYLMDVDTDHLLDPESKDSQAVGGIRFYYRSIWMSTITLYMAVTGGSDWEPLAAPLKRFNNQLYYYIFLFYIAFSFVSVLNVVTGMFVDAAMKISEQDDDAVLEEAGDQQEVKDLEDYFRLRQDANGTIDEEVFRECLQSHEMRAFMNRLDLRDTDVKQVFHRFIQMGRVDAQEFVEGCLRVRGDSKVIDIITLVRDTKRQRMQLNVLAEFLEDHLTAVHRSFSMLVGAPPPSIEKLEPRLAKLHVIELPVQHQHEHLDELSSATIPPP